VKEPYSTEDLEQLKTHLENVRHASLAAGAGGSREIQALADAQRGLDDFLADHALQRIDGPEVQMPAFTVCDAHGSKVQNFGGPRPMLDDEAQDFVWAIFTSADAMVAEEIRDSGLHKGTALGVLTIIRDQVGKLDPKLAELLIPERTENAKPRTALSQLDQEEARRGL
jgi:hypothetical protein